METKFFSLYLTRICGSAMKSVIRAIFLNTKGCHEAGEKRLETCLNIGELHFNNQQLRLLKFVKNIKVQNSANCVSWNEKLKPCHYNSWCFVQQPPLFFFYNRNSTNNRHSFKTQHVILKFKLEIKKFRMHILLHHHSLHIVHTYFLLGFNSNHESRHQSEFISAFILCT